jgi:inosine-uridine nucleoside N-ribohydrolase
MGANIDAVLALAVLYGSYAKVKVIGVTVSNANLQAAAFCDAMGRFYSGAAQTVPGRSQYYAPVGLPENGPRLPDSAMLAKPLALKSPDGKPVFANDVRDINDTADVPIALRNALLTQKPGEGVIVSAGPATNLVRAISVLGNKEFVAHNTRVLVVALGSFPEGPADPRVKADIAAARRLFAEWPTPIVAVGRELGNALPYPAASIEQDFAWSPNNPVAEAYRAYKPMPYDAPSQAMAAALYAVGVASGEKDDLFQLSEPGSIQILDDGRTKFVPSLSSRHRYLIANPAMKESIVKAYTTLASAKPAPPPQRGPRPQQNLANAAAPPLP